MPTFTTTGPITLRFNVPCGSVRIVATTTTEVDVDVRPGNALHSADVKAAEATLVDLQDGTLVIQAPDAERRAWTGRPPRLDVRVTVPDGSHVQGRVASADVQTEGRLGEVAVGSASGRVSFDTARQVDISTASGDITGRVVEGDARLQTMSASISVKTVAGDVRASTTAGDLELGEVGGATEAQTASGDVRLDQAGHRVVVKTASGDTRIGRIAQGEVDVRAASGDVSVGVPEGSAAWLEVSSLSGQVSSELEPSDDPGSTEKAVTVRAHTLSGAITVVRAR